MRTETAVKVVNQEENISVLRERRARGIAAMGLVKRTGDRFRVATPSLRGREAAYEVWRDDAGKVRCSCLEFEEGSHSDENFRCEHILAVKFALLAKNTEATPAGQTAPETITASPKLNANAAEESAQVAATHALSVRESEPVGDGGEVISSTAPINATDTLVADVSNVLSLANHKHSKEQTQMLQQSQTQTRAPQAQARENLVDPFSLEQQSHAANDSDAEILADDFTGTLSNLRSQVEPQMVKVREGWTDRSGKTHLVEYVEWHTVADILDRVAPTWSHAVRNITLIGDYVAVTAAITIDGVTREGVGTGTAGSETGIKKAEHDALKRAAVKFGIARDLYQRESDIIERDGTPTPQPPASFPNDPLAKTMADLVTPKQLGMIRALAREAGVDHDEECQSVMRCQTEELSKRAASGFIDHLKQLQANAVNDERALRRAS